MSFGSPHHPNHRPVCLLSAVLTGLFFLTTTPGRAWQIVTTNADSGPGSLRQAVASANAGDTVYFSTILSGQTILLTSGQILIDKSLTVNASNLRLRGGIAIDGNQASRVFEFAPGTTSTLIGLTLQHGDTTSAGGAIYLDSGATLTISNSTVTGSTGDWFGGGIYNGGTLTLNHCILSGNQANQYGGALCNFGSATVNNCGFTNNSSAQGGGGIYNVGTLVVNNSALSGNTGDWLGGGIYNSGPLTLNQCTLSGNEGGQYGGGLCNFGSVMINSSTFTGNTAMTGGGIDNAGSVTATNCTITGNQGSVGIGINNDNGGTFAMVNCTVYGNGGKAPLPGPETRGGGVANGGSFTSVNSIIAGNNAFSGPDFAGALNSQGHNLIQNSDGCAIVGGGPGDLLGCDPLLGPLDDYGGPTPTLPLRGGSPAIDAADVTQAPVVDQRGRARPYGVGADIGAFESCPPYTIRGVVSGSTVRDIVSLDAGGTLASVTNGIPFRLDDIEPGPCWVIPRNEDYLFVPERQFCPAGGDQSGVNFKAYHWNEVGLEDVTNGMLHMIYPATNGQICTLLSSTNMTQWDPVFTNRIGAESTVEWFVAPDREAMGPHYFRAQASPYQWTGGTLNPNLLWVAPNGDDATAQAGRQDLPFTWRGASLAAQPGSTVIITRGTYTISNTFWMQEGMTLIGDGATITNCQPTGSSYGIAMTNNCRVTGIKMVDGTQQFSYPIGIKTPTTWAAGSAITNVIIENCQIYGWSDCLVFSAIGLSSKTNRIQAIVRNNILTGPWDTMVVQGESYHDIQIYNNVFYAGENVPGYNLGETNLAHCIELRTLGTNSLVQVYSNAFHGDRPLSIPLWIDGRPGSVATVWGNYFTNNCLGLPNTNLLAGHTTARGVTVYVANNQFDGAVAANAPAVVIFTNQLGVISTNTP